MEKQQEDLSDRVNTRPLVEISNEISLDLPVKVDDLNELRNSIELLFTQIKLSISSLDSLTTKSQLYVCDYFDKLINDIDYETEYLITSEYDDLNKFGESLSEESNNDDENVKKKNEDEFNKRQDKSNAKVEQLNKIRDIMIKVIKNHEKECLNNYMLQDELYKKHSNEQHNNSNENENPLTSNLIYQLKQIEIESLEQELIKHEKNYADFSKLIKKHKKSKNKRLNAYNFKSHLDNLKLKLMDFKDEADSKLFNLNKMLFLNKTCVYVKNLNELENKLLTFDEQVEADVIGRDKSYYLSKRQPRSKPSDIGHLITINNFYLTNIEIELINVFLLRKLNNHFDGYSTDSFKAEYYIFLDLVDCLKRNGYNTEIKLKKCYLVIIELINIFHKYYKKKIFNIDIADINRKLEKIERLDFIRNQTVKDIEADFFEPLKNLRKLYLNKCEIETLNPNRFSELVNLKELNLKENQLKTLSTDSFSKLGKLRRLNVSANKLEVLKSNQYQDLKELEEMNVSLNSIRTIELGAFSNLYKLKQLSLSGNQIETLKRAQFVELINLEELDLSYNKIKKIDYMAFEGLYNLKILNLSRNQLTRLESNQFLQLMNLEILELFENKLKEINNEAFYGLFKLKSLHLGYNYLTSLIANQFYGLISLQVMNLSWNKITHVNLTSFDGLPSLKILNLSFNQLERIKPRQFKTLSNLQILLLSRNKINTLNENSFDGLSQLKRLYLVNNNLERFSKSQFERLKNLEKLDLSENKLELNVENNEFIPLNNLPNYYEQEV